MNCTLIERNTKKVFKFRVKERPKGGFMRREGFFFFSPSHISHIPHLPISPFPSLSVNFHVSDYRRYIFIYILLMSILLISIRFLYLELSLPSS